MVQPSTPTLRLRLRPAAKRSDWARDPGGEHRQVTGVNAAGYSAFKFVEASELGKGKKRLEMSVLEGRTWKESRRTIRIQNLKVSQLTFATIRKQKVSSAKYH